ncbi:MULTISPECIES: GspE/PulE family protein [Acidithiobacillus]|jgi:type II secretory ATPase GspE/PulE/Tfp pilus assembly ATPase PilB-like protein|uniref:GspE/PulE family protein n=1 Tax=Acidithiobacillus TaxID=119977 RepID=UPI0004E2899A|nr:MULTISPECIES: ATPase, T2SS/T4P/T4SS family [Acidithiobacillus]MDD5280607.1 ATPase, T2SS/T4P/T4SS family [Acidithiobacillus sp.]
MASLLEHFRPWTSSDPIPGFQGLLIPETFGQGLSSLHEAMFMVGYKKHEIFYIHDYVRVTGVHEQEAVLHLGIGGHDRIAAALALWKGHAWLPLGTAKNIDIRYLRPYAVPLQTYELNAGSIPLAASPKGLLYGVAHTDAFKGPLIETHLNVSIQYQIDRVKNLVKDGINPALSLRDVLERLEIIAPDILEYLDEQWAGETAAGTHPQFAEMVYREGEVAAPILALIMGKIPGSSLPEGVSQDPFVCRENPAHIPPVHYAITTTGSVESLYQKGIRDTERDFVNACKMEGEDRYNEIINRLLVHASYQGFSDLHFSPVQEAGIVERRKDGTKGLVRSFPREEYIRLVGIILNRMGNVDTRLQAEGRIPEEELPPELAGRFEFRIEYMSVVQGRGETGSLTLRVLNLMNETAVLETLGFTDDDLDYIYKVLHTGKGLVLATGPTGSGKTTTLYAMMRAIDAIQTSVQSVENPVEIRVGLWRQHQLIRERAEHLEWADWNKGLLRNDPDVILQGEVRNADLFEQVADMANTGHLAFATFHASSAALAVGRLRQMRTTHGDPLDIDMIASLMHCIIAQGLARRLCPHCAIPDERPSTQLFLSTLPEAIQKTATPKMAADMGCTHCGDTGYVGRFLVYEILRFTKAVREQITSGCTLADIEKAMPAGSSMMDKLKSHVAQGDTSVEEAYRLSGEIF